MTLGPSLKTKSGVLKDLGATFLIDASGRSHNMVSVRDYEIYLLFLLLVKFHGSGNCEIYSPAKDVTVFFTKC